MLKTANPNPKKFINNYVYPISGIIYIRGLFPLIKIISSKLYKLELLLELR